MAREAAVLQGHILLNGLKYDRDLYIRMTRLVLRPVVLAVPPEKRAMMLAMPPVEALDEIVQTMGSVLPSGAVNPDNVQMIRGSMVISKISWRDLGL